MNTLPRLSIGSACVTGGEHGGLDAADPLGRRIRRAQRRRTPPRSGSARASARRIPGRTRSAGRARSSGTGARPTSAASAACRARACGVGSLPAWRFWAAVTAPVGISPGSRRSTRSRPTPTQPARPRSARRRLSSASANSASAKLSVGQLSFGEFGERLVQFRHDRRLARRCRHRVRDDAAPARGLRHGRQRQPSPAHGGTGTALPRDRPSRRIGCADRRPPGQSSASRCAASRHAVVTARRVAGTGARRARRPVSPPPARRDGSVEKPISRHRSLIRLAAAAANRDGRGSAATSGSAVGSPLGRSPPAHRSARPSAAAWPGLLRRYPAVEHLAERVEVGQQVQVDRDRDRAGLPDQSERRVRRAAVHDHAVGAGRGGGDDVAKRRPRCDGVDRAQRAVAALGRHPAGQHRRQRRLVELQQEPRRRQPPAQTSRRAARRLRPATRSGRGRHPDRAASGRRSAGRATAARVHGPATWILTRPSKSAAASVSASRSRSHRSCVRRRSCPRCEATRHCGGVQLDRHLHEQPGGTGRSCPRPGRVPEAPGRYGKRQLAEDRLDRLADVGAGQRADAGRAPGAHGKRSRDATGAGDGAE